MSAAVKKKKTERLPLLNIYWSDNEVIFWGVELGGEPPKSAQETCQMIQLNWKY